MKSFDTDLKKYAEKIKLKVAERAELRERVLSYMEYHPLPKQAPVKTAIQEGIVSEKFIKLHLSGFQLRIMGGVFILLLILMPILAERSVPGEVLYILKTGVTEKIQGQLASSSYEKIEFETKLMERRIAEARILASEGKLTEETKTQLQATVKEHAQSVKNELTELRTQDADSAAIAEIEFNSSLEVQSSVLSSDDVEGGDMLEGILVVVNEVRDESAQNQEEQKPSYIGLVARMEKQTTRAFELFESIKETATAEEITDIERRISDINRLFAEAKEGSTTNEETSVTELAHLIGRTQKLIAFMANIDVRSIVKLETLVPVVLSETERIDIAREDIRVVENIEAEVVLNKDLVEEEGVKEKVEEGLIRIEELLNTAKTALELPDIHNAEIAIAEAKALIADLDALTTIPSGEVLEVEEIPEEVESDTEVPVEEIPTEEEAMSGTQKQSQQQKKSE